MKGVSKVTHTDVHTKYEGTHTSCARHAQRGQLACVHACLRANKAKAKSIASGTRLLRAPALYGLHSGMHVRAQACQGHRLRFHHSHLRPVVRKGVAQRQPAQAAPRGEQACEHLRLRCVQACKLQVRAGVGALGKGKQASSR